MLLWKDAAMLRSRHCIPVECLLSGLTISASRCIEHWIVTWKLIYKLIRDWIHTRCWEIDVGLAGHRLHDVLIDADDCFAEFQLSVAQIVIIHDVVVG